MNTNSGFDRRAAAWLADGPTELADRVLDAALREVHLTHQRRRWSTLWRTSSMSPRLSAAAGIAIVAVIGVGALLLLNRSPGIGGTTSPKPTATQAATPTAAPTPFVAPSPTPPSTIGWIPYTSAQYGFQISYPSTWQQDIKATRNWVLATDRLGFPGSGMNFSADHFIGDGLGGTTGVTGLAADVPAGMSEQAWLDAYYAGGAFCPTNPAFVVVTVDGHPGRLDPCYDAQAIVFIGKRVYVFAIHRTDNQPLFASFLSTVKFP